MERTQIVFGHLSNKNANQMEIKTSLVAASPQASDDDVVICSALRTPICRARRGGLKDTLPDDLLSKAFEGVLADVNLDPKLVGDICVGNVLQPGAGANIARFAQFFSGIPETVPISATNRQCSSGLQACMNIAGSIKAGVIDVGIGAGVESMSINSLVNRKTMDGLNPRVFEVSLATEALTPMGVESMSTNQMGGGSGLVLNPLIGDFPKAADCLIPMGITSENVAERYGVSREKQDTMAKDSHAKAAKAQKLGLFDQEIIPVKTILKDKDGNETSVVISKDDGVRPGTTMEILGRLKPAFKPDGTTTAGNSSQVSDGAAAVILARRSAARRLGLPVLGVFKSYAVVGVPPDVMGIGPAYAIPEALKKAGLTVDDIDIFEINEAFASQATYSVEKLGIPMEKVNPKGGAIALGHPLGCTGARQIGTLLHEMKRRGKRGYGVVSMCIGTGMGAAAVFEYSG